MNFYHIRPIIKIIMVLTLILVSALAMAADKKAPADKAAVVNGVVITKGEFERELDFFVKRASQRGQQVPESQMPTMKSNVLESLIDRELLFQESQKKGIQIKAESVTEQLTIVKKRFSDEAEFKKVLAENNLTESKLKTDIKREMAIQQVIEKEVYERVQITDAETKSFYDKNPQQFQQPERVKASHILIKVDAAATDAQKSEARKKIQEVQKKAQEGEDFAALAKTYSEGPSGPRGGDLGYFRRGQMVKPFEEAAFSMKTNEVSDIVETKFGYHLIKVGDKQPAQKISYDEVKDRLSEHLKKQKMNSETRVYVQTLRDGAKIEKF